MVKIFIDRQIKQYKSITKNGKKVRITYKENDYGTKVHTNRPKNDVYYCGTLVCGICGKKLTTSRTIGRLKKDGTRSIFNSYRCINREKKMCNARYISHIKTEEAFVEYLKNHIAEFDSFDNIVIEKKDVELVEITSIKKLLINKKAKQREVMNLFIAENIDYEKFKYMTDELNNIIKINEEKLSRLEHKDADYC